MDVYKIVLTNPESYHFPIQVNIFEDRAPMKPPFKFETMWFRDVSFIPMLKSW